MCNRAAVATYSSAVYLYLSSSPQLYRLRLAKVEISMKLLALDGMHVSGVHV